VGRSQSATTIRNNNPNEQFKRAPAKVAQRHERPPPIVPPSAFSRRFRAPTRPAAAQRTGSKKVLQKGTTKHKQDFFRAFLRLFAAIPKIINQRSKIKDHGPHRHEPSRCASRKCADSVREGAAKNTRP
jgi:hypothetical protein